MDILGNMVMLIYRNLLLSLGEQTHLSIYNYYLELNFDFKLSKNASLFLIVPGSGTGLPGRLDSFVISSVPSGISFEPPGTVRGVAMDSFSSSLNCFEILLAVIL